MNESHTTTQTSTYTKTIVAAALLAGLAIAAGYGFIVKFKVFGVPVVNETIGANNGGKTDPAETQSDGNDVWSGNSSSNSNSNSSNNSNSNTNSGSNTNTGTNSESGPSSN